MTTIASTQNGIRFAGVQIDDLSLDEATVIQDFGQSDPIQLLADTRAGKPTPRQVGALLLVAGRRIDPSLDPDALAQLTYHQAYTAAADVLLAGVKGDGEPPAPTAAATPEPDGPLDGLDSAALIQELTRRANAGDRTATELARLGRTATAAG